MSSLPAAAVRSSQKMARTVLQQQQRRMLSDVTITRTGKPIIRVQGGRYGEAVLVRQWDEIAGVEDIMRI